MPHFKIIMETTSVVLAGVGGQGILLASEIIAQAAVAAGYDVKTNEVHGMAQRGGSVIAQIRFGTQVHTPIISRKTATVLGSLELLESLRYIDYLADDGLAVVSSQRIVPVTVSSGATPYPTLDEAALKPYFPRLVYLDAVGEASQLGNAKAANTVLLGAMSNQLTLPIEAWQQAIKQSVKPKFLEVNLQAFYRGREYATHI